MKEKVSDKQAEDPIKGLKIRNRAPTKTEKNLNLEAFHLSDLLLVGRKKSIALEI